MTDLQKLKHVEQAIKQKFKNKKLVFGSGLVGAKVVFVSEMLGAAEEKEGKPLAGKAGQLINKLLKEHGIDKRKVYITNVIKYFPSQPIAPTPKEIKSHATFLKEEIRTINPQIVVTFGNLALNGVGMRQPLDNVHGRTFNLGHFELLPTFHPEHALKDESIKARLSADFAKIKELLKAKIALDKTTQ